jgi:RimJ/RimL family protein N-acetyltransferase
MRIDVFPAAKYADAWHWLNQDARANFDDYGPPTLEAFRRDMDARRDRGEQFFGVWDDASRLVGIVGYRPMAPHWGMLAGICFEESVHGQPITRAGVRAVLDWVFASGSDKVLAWYFAHNGRVGRFLAKLGALHEGYLRKQTQQNGEPVDMFLVAFFREGF